MESRDILFYMLNDEKDEVRIESVKILTEILKDITIKVNKKLIKLLNLFNNL